MIPKSVKGIGERIGRALDQISITLFDANDHNIARFCFVALVSESRSFAASLAWDSPK